MKIKQLLTLSLIGLAVGACKRPDGGEDPTNVDPEGELVKAKLSVSIPKSIRTYAPGDLDVLATDEEKLAKTMDVFIYDDGGAYALTYKHFDFAASGPTGTDKFIVDPDDDTKFTTAEFDVREGDKLVYVGINMPNFIVDRLKTGYYVNEVFEQVDLIDLLATNEVGNGSREVAFFNTSTPVTTAINASSPTTISASVSRLVAKVIVMAADDDGDVSSGNTASWDVSGGVVSNLEFAIGQRNNQMYVSPLVSDADPNYEDSTIPVVGVESPNNIQILQDVDISEYATVNDLGASPSDADTYMRYATENTSASHRHQDVTYVSIKATFSPHRFGGDPDTGELPDDGTEYDNTAPSNGFYAVFTGDNVGGTDALGVRYFADETDLTLALAEARAFVAGAYFNGLLGGTSIAAGTGVYNSTENDPNLADHYIRYYENSNCYYRVYLNPDEATDPSGTTGTGGYNIFRNTIYLATITGVNYIGTTAPDILPGSVDANDIGTPTYPGSWFPNPLGAAVDPSDPINPADWIEDLTISLDFTPWDQDDQNYETY